MSIYIDNYTVPASPPPRLAVEVDGNDSLHSIKEKINIQFEMQMDPEQHLLLLGRTNLLDLDASVAFATLISSSSGGGSNTLLSLCKKGPFPIAVFGPEIEEFTITAHCFLPLRQLLHELKMHTGFPLKEDFMTLICYSEEDNERTLPLPPSSSEASDDQLLIDFNIFSRTTNSCVLNLKSRPRIFPTGLFFYSVSYGPPPIDGAPLPPPRPILTGPRRPILSPPLESVEMQITVWFPSMDWGFHLAVEPAMTVCALKTKIVSSCLAEDELRGHTKYISQGLFHLVFKGEVLKFNDQGNNTRTLCRCGVGDKDRILLVDAEPFPVCIQFMQLGGLSYDLSVHAFDTVRSFKEGIFRETGVPPSEILHMWRRGLPSEILHMLPPRGGIRQKKLEEDDRTLMDYGVLKVTGKYDKYLGRSIPPTILVAASKDYISWRKETGFNFF